MGMTHEESINRLEWLRMVGNHVDSVTLGKEDMPYFDMAIAALREQPRWISVEERLPEGGGSVLIYSPFGGVAEGTYSEHYKRWVQYRWSVFEQEVTHWMPLPEPPEVEG